VIISIEIVVAIFSAF